MNNFIKKNWQVIVLLVLALFTRFLFLSYPAEVVFDEIYYGQFASRYFTHEYYFSNHPPLGKLIIAGTAGLLGFRGGFGLKNIGQTISKTDILTIRFAPALFGVLFVLLTYFLILKIGLSKKAAFLGGFLVLFDNAVLTQSKFALIDIFLLFFGFLSFYFLICYKNLGNNLRKQYLFLALAAFFATLSFAVKWTGAVFFAVIFLYLLFEFFKKKRWDIVLRFGIVAALALLTYYSIFMIHFGLLYKTGPGDAFMSAGFLKTLSGTNVPDSVKPSSQWQRFSELNKLLYTTHANITATHPYSSKWQQWPLNKRPIWYWNKTDGDLRGNIYLAGNPIIWWSVLLAVIYCASAMTFKDFRKKIPPIIYFLLFGYFLNLLAFIFIGRVAFLYHYLPSLVFGILILAILFDKIFNDASGENVLGVSKRNSRAIYFGFLAYVFLAFIMLSPLTYGFMIPSETHSFYNKFINLLLN